MLPFLILAWKESLADIRFQRQRTNLVSPKLLLTSFKLNKTMAFDFLVIAPIISRMIYDIDTVDSRRVSQESSHSRMVTWGRVPE